MSEENVQKPEDEIVEFNIGRPYDVLREDDERVRFYTPDGDEVILSEFRATEDPDMMMARFRRNKYKSEEFTYDYVRMPNKLKTAMKHGIEYLEHHKGKAAVIGSAVITIAAGTGIFVKRFKNK